jgi:transposase
LLGRPSKYSAEFKRDAVALVRTTGKPVNQVARELGISHETLRNWVKQDRVDRGHGDPGELTTAERDELRSLRRRVAELEVEKEILRKAAAYFAKEMGR